MNKRKARPLTESPRFETFTKQRDAGLELVLAKYSEQITAIVDTLRRRALQVASHSALRHQAALQLKKAVAAFETELRHPFQMGAERAAGLIQSLRRTTYVLSAMGGAEAIARALDTDPVLKLERRHGHAERDRHMQLGGSVSGRVDLAFTRLLKDVVDAYQYGLVVGSTPEEMLSRIERAFPTKKAQKRPPKVMARLTEASSDDTGFTSRSGSSGFIYPDEWNEIVEDYLNDEIPFGRAPYDKVFYLDPQDDESNFYRYQWQVEQEMTDDFVQSVRMGENEAANQAGIDEFSWIAIVDSKTDHCCTVRDGKTTKEIEEDMGSGQISEEECDAVVAPAHFSCRCRMAPMSEDMPEETPPDYGSFNDWLQERMQQV